MFRALVRIITRAEPVVLRVLIVSALLIAQPASAQSVAPWDVAEMRLQIVPKDAIVYVDGYVAGKVDDFDGTFQRLRLTPGQHTLVVHHAGRRSFREELYIGPGASRTIRTTLEPLAPGEPEDPRPQPDRNIDSRPADELPPSPPPDYRRGGPPSTGGRGGPPPEADPSSQSPPSQPPQPATQPATFATLTVSVSPSRADVLVDGQKWRTESADDWLLIQISPGRHRIEIQKDGYRPYITEATVQAGETVPLSVTLTRDR